MNDNAVVQNDQQRSADPRTVQSMTDALRIIEKPGTEPMLTENDSAKMLFNDENDTYAIKESTGVFLELAFCAQEAHR